jgi:putative MATE family efflux protein
LQFCPFLFCRFVLANIFMQTANNKFITKKQKRVYKMTNSKSINKDKNFTRVGFYKQLLRLGLPIALQNLATFSLTLSDTLMVGRLGDAAISGTYMANQIQALLQVFSAGVEGALLAISAQHWGRGDRESVCKLCGIGLTVSATVGLLLTLACSIFPRAIVSAFSNRGEVLAAGADYLKILCLSFPFFCISQTLIAAMRSVEATKVGFVASLLSLSVNVILNFALIFGKFGAPQLGVRGAAIATLAARITECAVAAIYVFFIDKKLKIKLRTLFSFDKEIAKNYFKHGTPIICGQLIWGVNMLASTAIIGRLNSDGASTALSIANTLNSLIYVVTNGISGALGIITGKTVGSGQEDKMRNYAKWAQAIFIILGIFTAISIQLLKNPFISIYNISAESIRESRKFINLLSLFSVGTCYQSACLFGLLKSGGDMKFVFKVEAVAVLLFVLPSALVASRLAASPSIVFACLKSDQILKCLPAAIRTNRFKWMRNCTAKE